MTAVPKRRCHLATSPDEAGPSSAPAISNATTMGLAFR